jgi:hypothetical protein
VLTARAGDDEVRLDVGNSRPEHPARPSYSGLASCVNPEGLLEERKFICKRLLRVLGNRAIMIGSSWR